MSKFFVNERLLVALDGLLNIFDNFGIFRGGPGWACE